MRNISCLLPTWGRRPKATAPCLQYAFYISQMFSNFLKCSQYFSNVLKSSQIVSDVLNLSQFVSIFLKYSQRFSDFLNIKYSQHPIFSYICFAPDLARKMRRKKLAPEARKQRRALEKLKIMSKPANY